MSRKHQIAAMHRAMRRLLTAHGKGAARCTCDHYPHLPRCGERDLYGRPTVHVARPRATPNRPRAR